MAIFDSYFCRKEAVMDSFLGMEFFNFLPTGWKKAEDVKLVLHYYVTWT